MKIAQLPYVKFVFLCNDGSCYSTADIAMLEHIRQPNSDNRAYSFDVGDRITFAPNSDKVFRITEVAIRHLHDDTNMMRLGFDSEDCVSMQGAAKEWILKVLIRAELE
jgi:hypothetical protein